MEESKIIELASKLARRIAQTPTITDEDIYRDAMARADEDKETAGVIADLAKEAAPYYRQKEAAMAEKFGPEIQYLHDVLKSLMANRTKPD